MSRYGLACLLFATLAWSQGAQQAPAPPSAAAPAAPAPAAAEETKAPEPPPIPPEGAVITIKGLCDNPPSDPANAADCKTVVTRAQFEKLVDILSPGMPPFARRQLATRYANALVMAREAHKMGLDKGPRFEELLDLARLQVMNQELNTALQKKAGEIPDKDVEEYYKNNSAAYEQADLQRLYVPKTKQLPASKVKLSEAASQKRQADADATMKTEAEALRKRAAAGEDFTALQKEAFLFAGQKSTPPTSKVGSVRRTSLPLAHNSVMDLKTGEVSTVIADQSGYFVYKVGSKGTVPLDQVRDEIHNTLRAQRLQDEMHAIQASATPTLDDTYFAVTGGAAPQGVAVPAGATPKPKPSSSEPK
jgi:hypothetical protein